MGIIADYMHNTTWYYGSMNWVHKYFSKGGFVLSWVLVSFFLAPFFVRTVGNVFDLSMLLAWGFVIVGVYIELILLGCLVAIWMICNVWFARNIYDTNKLEYWVILVVVLLLLLVWGR